MVKQCVLKQWYFVDKIMLYLNWCFASNNEYFVDKIMLYLNWCFASNNDILEIR